MKNSRTNRYFWALILAGILVVTFQAVSLFGPLGAPMGIGTGAALGMVIYYLAAMIWSALGWIRQQLQRR